MSSNYCMVHNLKVFEEDEDPYQHLQFFEDVCGTFKLNASTYDKMKLKLFAVL